jgi:hypothetical protein
MNPVMGKALPGRLTPVKESKAPKYEVKIYPNPAKDILFVDGIIDKNLLEIYNLNGVLIQQQTLSTSNYIDIHELPTGIYVIKISNLLTHQIGTAKFIKTE